jgi:hypothetical protein
VTSYTETKGYVDQRIFRMACLLHFSYYYLIIYSDIPKCHMSKLRPTFDLCKTRAVHSMKEVNWVCRKSAWSLAGFVIHSLDHLDWTGFSPGRGERILPLSSVSRPALRPAQLPVQWVPGVLSPGLKRGRGVTLTTHPHLEPRSRMSRSYTSFPSKSSRGV